MTLLVAGILLGIGVPNVMEFQRNGAMTAVANDLITGVSDGARRSRETAGAGRPVPEHEPYRRQPDLLAGRRRSSAVRHRRLHRLGRREQQLRRRTAPAFSRTRTDGNGVVDAERARAHASVRARRHACACRRIAATCSFAPTRLHAPGRRVVLSAPRALDFALRRPRPPRSRRVFVERAYRADRSPGSRPGAHREAEVDPVIASSAGAASPHLPVHEKLMNHAVTRHSTSAAAASAWSSRWSRSSSCPSA